MSGFDGTGPQGRGPMTGRGMGFCVLRESGELPGQVEGLAGIDGVPIGKTNRDEAEREKEVFGDGAGPSGMGTMTGRAAGLSAGFPVPSYMNPGRTRGHVSPVGAGPVRPYGAPSYRYGAGYTNAYTGWLGRWIGRGFGFRRGCGRGGGRRGGRGRCGYGW